MFILNFLKISQFADRFLWRVNFVRFILIKKKLDATFFLKF